MAVNLKEKKFLIFLANRIMLSYNANRIVITVIRNSICYLMMYNIDNNIEFSFRDFFLSSFANNALNFELNSK